MKFRYPHFRAGFGVSRPPCSPSIPTKTYYSSRPPSHSPIPASPRAWPQSCSRHDKATGLQGRCSMLGQTASASVRFEALDALRGVCALLVVLFHIPICHALKDVAAFANLQFCVDMFFALSGFVLCHAYGERLNEGADGVRFTVMRLARLW